MTALGFIETKGLIGAIESADAMLKAADVSLLEKTLVGAGLVTITVTGEVSAVKASVDAAVAAIERINGAQLVSQHVIARPDTELKYIIATEPPQTVEAIADTEAGTGFEPKEAAEEEQQEDTLTKTVEISEPEKADESADEDIEETKEILVEEETSAKDLENIQTKTQEPESDNKEAEEESATEILGEESERSEEKPKKMVPVSKKAIKAASKTESPHYEISQLKKMNVSKLRIIARSFDGFSIARKEIKFARKKELIEAILNAYRQEKEE